MEDKNKEKGIQNIIWTALFAVMYPIITAFSLLFTAIVAVFSNISRVLVFVFKKLTK